MKRYEYIDYDCFKNETKEQMMHIEVQASINNELDSTEEIIKYHKIQRDRILKEFKIRKQAYTLEEKYKRFENDKEISYNFV